MSVTHVFPPVVSHELLYVLDTKRKTLPRVRPRRRRNRNRDENPKAVTVQKQEPVIIGGSEMIEHKWGTK